MHSLDQDLQNWLTRYLADCAAVAGTVHRHENAGLRLVACVNIPDPVRDAVAWVPSGKGMAGLALERGEAVQTCNLQADPSGAVRPGAKAVHAQAAAALPVRDQQGCIIAVVGIAFAGEREISEAELEKLTAAAESLPGARA
jgi:L-methionine (R)-S-oxide reductase